MHIGVSVTDRQRTKFVGGANFPTGADEVVRIADLSDPIATDTVDAQIDPFRTIRPMRAYAYLYTTRCPSATYEWRVTTVYRCAAGVGRVKRRGPVPSSDSDRAVGYPLAVPKTFRDIIPPLLFYKCNYGEIFSITLFTTVVKIVSVSFSVFFFSFVYSSAKVPLATQSKTMFSM